MVHNSDCMVTNSICFVYSVCSPPGRYTVHLEQQGKDDKKIGMEKKNWNVLCSDSGRNNDERFYYLLR